MDGLNDPALTLDAPQVDVVEETPTTATSPEQGRPATAPEASEPTSPSASPAAQSVSKPDYSTLLQDEQFRKTIAEQEWYQAELHRARSDGGRRVKAELDQLKAQQDALRQRQELLEKDDAEAGEEYKKQIREQIQSDHLRGLHFDAQRQLLGQLLDDVNSHTAAELGRRGFKDGIPQLDARQYNTPHEWLVATAIKLAEQIAEKRASELAPKLAEAIVTERSGVAREQEPSPVTTPAGSVAASDTEFIADYAAGKNNNTARAMKQLREWGIL